MAATNLPEAFAASLEQCANGDIDALIQQDGGQTARRRALAAVRRLQQRLETPYEMTRRLAWQEPAHVMAIKVALDQNLLEELSKHNVSEGVPVSTLANNTSTPEEIVRRILRHLAACGVVKETGPNQYAPTPKSNAFLEPPVSSGLDFWLDFSSKAMALFPQYLREGRWEDRGTPDKGPWQYATGTETNFFAYLSANPAAQKHFAQHMVAMSVDRVDWINLYPAEERLLKGAEPDGPLLVDVGGGVGHDMIRFQNKHPQPKSRLFVQDRAEAIAEAEPNAVIEFQVHDFFTPQPIKGARAYFMHYILHDWPDDKCLEILGHIRDAMRKGYSKLLVNEFVVAAQNADPFNTALDMVMMSFIASKERTEEDWRELFEQAGLKVVGIFRSPANHESVLEVEVA